MSDELPDTDDPFELLGVRPPVDERALKRAYVKLIKRFRPERDPAAFKRIHAAYERATAMAAWPIYAEPADGGEHESSESDASAAPVEGDETETEADRVWREVMVRHEDGGADEALEMLIDSLERGDDIAADILARLSPALLRRLVVSPRLRWSLLARQPNRWAAVELLSLRFDELVLADGLDVALAEVEEPAFRGAVLETPELDTLARAVLVAAAWHRGDELDELASRYMGDASDGLDGHYADARRLAPAWDRIKREIATLPAFTDFLECFAAVGPMHKRILVDAVAEELRTVRLAYVHLLDCIRHVDEDLLGYVLDLTELLVYGEELAFEDLPDAEKAYVVDAMDRVKPDSIPQAPSRAVPGAAIVGMSALSSLFLGLTTGAIVFMAALVGVGVWIGIDRFGHYAAGARFQLADAIIETGLPPHRIAEWNDHRLGENTTRLRFDLDAGWDMPLQVLARLARVSILWTRSEGEPDDGRA